MVLFRTVIIRQFSGVAGKSKTYFDKLNLVAAKAKGNLYRFELDGRPFSMPGSRTPVSVPSKLVGDLLVAEWQGALSPVKETPQILVSQALVLNAMMHLLGVEFPRPSCQRNRGKSVAPRSNHKRPAALSIHRHHLLSYSFFEVQEGLLKREQEMWTPVIRALEAKYGIQICTTQGLSNPIHPTETVDRLSEELSAMSPFSLSAMESLTRHFKSFLIALALRDGLLGPAEAVSAALLEIDFQASIWGHLSETHDIQKEAMIRQSYLSSLLFH